MLYLYFLVAAFLGFLYSNLSFAADRPDAFISTCAGLIIADVFYLLYLFAKKKIAEIKNNA